MKKFAFYLPQFHEIPENNEWWGEGFTEWVNVKKAKPLFTGHAQPKVPMNNNYYSLDSKETLAWQADIANKYCVDGMIFYHYYFEGKKLLEKPCEMLLEQKEIPMNFFFCWANHSWYRSWDGTKELLIEQTYGDINDWEKHFQYLLPFFKDKRYEKRNNKPLFMIYISDFLEKKEMIKYFDKRCKENGFNGLCLIDVVMHFEDKTEKVLDDTFIFYREPNASYYEYKIDKKNLPFRIKNKIGKIFHNKFKFRYVEKMNANDLLLKGIQKNVQGLRGLFFEWDNTPRHSYRGYIITAPSKETFMKYMDNIKDIEYLFINAWNEWGEGMMLEPTQENGYKYLEWIKEWSEKNENRINRV